jgi:NADH-quinone oxidoreductase subunit G
MGAGAWAEGQMVTALRMLGFDVVVDTNFSADLTIMEEGSELVERVTHGGVLPQMTSCCPGWVKFVEYYYPELIPNLSSARSPMMMHGSTLKTYNAQQLGVSYDKIVNVAIMPCVAKKFEASREQFAGLEGGAGKYYNDDTVKDMDYVLSVRELADMIREKLDVDFANLPEGQYDQIGSTAGLIFGNSGGVMEAAVRSAYTLITGDNPPEGLYNLEDVRGLEGVKYAEVPVPGVGTVKVAVASGLANARQLCEQIKAGKADFHFLEVMACPGGCISGGGQPKTAVPPQDWVREARTATVYAHDKAGVINGSAAGAGQMTTDKGVLKLSHKNPQIDEIYKEFLGEPLSHLAHDLCHTHYVDRSDSLIRKEV